MLPLFKSITSTLLSVFILHAITVVPVEGRIGESRNAIERRLFSSGGIMYRDDATERNRRQGMPYNQFINFLPTGTEVRIYFKTDNGRRPQSSELEEKRISQGWDLHVVYIGNKSAIEIYKRSQGISEYEMNELLARLAGGSFWKKIDKKEIEPSAFGYEMVTDNGSLRAKRLKGNSIMVFDAKIDTRLAGEKESDLIEKAPASVKGF